MADGGQIQAVNVERRAIFGAPRARARVPRANTISSTALRTSPIAQRLRSRCVPPCYVLLAHGLRTAGYSVLQSYRGQGVIFNASRRASARIARERACHK